MKSVIASVAFLSLLPSILGQLTINTPTNVVQCEPILLSWTGGTPPYFLGVIPANQPSAPDLKQFPTTSGNSLTWIVDLPAGDNIGMSLKDGTGLQAFSSSFTINNSTTTSCLNTAVTESASGVVAPTGSAAAPSGSSASSIGAGPVGPVTTSKAGTPASTGGSTASGSAAGSSSTGASSSASGATHATPARILALVGVMGAIGATLL